VPDMVDAICSELAMRSHEFTDELSTVYFGGGTPSILSPELLSRIFETIHRYYRVNSKAEITLEANPEDIHLSALRHWQKVGINRLSIGIQALNNEELKWMNRMHTADKSLNSVRVSQDVGYENITVDLIYGSKYQSLQGWKNTLESVFSLNVPHLSAYHLTVEKGTPLGVLVKRGQEPAVDEEMGGLFFMHLISATELHGYEAYEISNFAKPGYRSQHNSNYWLGVPYLGIGPSAHSYQQNSRRWNVSNNQQYIKALKNNLRFWEVEELDLNTRFNEYIMTGLRRMEGCQLDYIRKTFGEDKLYHLMKELPPHRHLVEITDTVLKLNLEGRLMADRIASDLFYIE